MEKLNEKALNYATEKSSQILNAAIAQAYIDGYRDGYKDREDEIPVDLRGNNTEYIDLGLPSGTLWASDYEKENDNVTYLPYGKAALLNIPTMEQWEELFKSCRWEYVTPNGVKTDSYISEVLCVGPNGNVLKFLRTGMYEVSDNISNLDGIFFWLTDNEEKSEKNSVSFRRYLTRMENNVRFYISEYRVNKYFSGYKLPIRLVRTKNCI